MNSIDVTNTCPYDWNKYLLENKLGTIFHTQEYADYAEKWNKWKPLFFRVLDSKGTILLQNLFFEHGPQLKKYPTVMKKVLKQFKKNLRWAYGPIYSSEESLKSFFTYIIKSKKSFTGNIHPLSRIKKIDFDLQKIQWSTFLIDLSKSKSELYSNLQKHSAQKNIERALDRNVIVEEITDKTWSEYSDLLGKFRISRDRENVNTEEGKDFWDILKKDGFTGFLAKKDGIPIGGLTFSYFNGYLNEWGVARTEKDTNEKLYAQDLIKWKIIEWGLSRKMRYFDLSGFNPEPKSEKEKGIFRFKQKWGGNRNDYWILRSKK